MSHVRTTHDSLYAMQCVLLTLAGPADEVLLVGGSDERFALAAKLTRTRSRQVAADDVYDAIGAHTRALVLVDPDEDALELSAFELPLILLVSRAREAVACFPRGEERRCSRCSRRDSSVRDRRRSAPRRALDKDVDELGRWMDAAVKGPMR